MGISSGWGVDYHSIGNDLAGVNYSSARVGMLETRELYKTLQVWLTNQLVRPIFRRWIELENMSGRLPVKKKSLHELLPATFVVVHGIGSIHKK